MSLQDDILTIETPENVAFGYPVAGIGSRFIAALVDTALIAVLQLVVFVLGSLLISNFFGDPANSLTQTDTIAWLLAVSGLLSFAFLWGYYIFFEMLWNGQSPGKRLAKLRVIRADGTPVTLTESIIRNLVRLIDFLPLLYAAGVVTMFIDSRARRLGDLAAGTLVVREAGAKIDLDTFIHQPQAPGFPPVVLGDIGRLPLEMLGQAELEMLASFYKRRNEFSDATAVGEKLLLRLFRRMETPLPDLNSREVDWLLSYINASISGSTRKD